MKKFISFVLVFGLFLICSSSVFAYSNFDVSGLIADNEDVSGEDDSTNLDNSDSSNSSNNNDSSSGGNHFDASWDKSDPITTGSSECSTIFKNADGSFNEFGEFVQDVFTLLKFAAPVLVIAFSTVDYAKAISAQNADEIKKANGKFVKRLIAGIAVFLLPFLLDFIFDIFGLYGLDTCGVR